jgi:hypothetical protein
MESSNRSVVSVDDHDRFIKDRCGDEVTWPRKVRRTGDHLPGAREDRLPFLLKDLWREIFVGAERVCARRWLKQLSGARIFLAERRAHFWLVREREGSTEALSFAAIAARAA